MLAIALFPYLTCADQYWPHPRRFLPGKVSSDGRLLLELLPRERTAYERQIRR